MTERKKGVLVKNKKITAWQEGNSLIIKYLQPQIIKIPLNDRMAIDIQVIRMIKMRDKANRKYFVQK